MKVMRKGEKKEIKIVALVLASFLMLVCIVAASPDSSLRFIDSTPANSTHRMAMNLNNDSAIGENSTYANLDGVTYTQEQEFTLGVLVINTHKSIYSPDETAFIGIAVLDNEGHMVCDADVTLTITDPSNIETVLSTGNGLINVSPQCCVYGVTNLPDFYTNYEVGGAGTYVMNLTAVTADGTKSITDEFTVQNSVDFEVARDGATRIYPPVPYVMNFTIKANKDYDGLIREYVPASFVITPQDGLIVATVGDISKILTWNKNLVKGETYNIYYEFDAPDVSPYLFVLGELEIGDWKETRKWRIAADATRKLWVNDYDNNRDGWTKVGTSPYLDAQDQPTNYGYNATNKVLWGNFDFADSAALGTINSVHFYAYGKCAQVGRDPTAWGWDGTTWVDFKKFPFTTVWGWGNIDLSEELDTWTKINGVRLYIEGRTGQAPGTFVDACYISVDYTPPTWVSDRDP
jgi:hypothetical protein